MCYAYAMLQAALLSALLAAAIPEPQRLADGSVTPGPVIGDTYFFSAELGGVCRLYRTDGTPETTRELYTIGAPPFTWARLGSGFVFAADDAAIGREPVVFDGDGFLPIDVRLGSEGSSPFSFASGAQKAYFVATTPEHGQEIWRTDGSVEGTVVHVELRDGPQSETISEIVAVNDWLACSATDSLSATSNAHAVWVSDGTPSGTHTVFVETTGELINDTLRATSAWVYFTTVSAYRPWVTVYRATFGADAASQVRFQGRIVTSKDAAYVFEQNGAPGAETNPRTIFLDNDIEVALPVVASVLPTQMLKGDSRYYLLNGGAAIGLLNCDASSCDHSEINQSATAGIAVNDDFYFAGDNSKYGSEMFILRHGKVTRLTDVQPGLEGSQPRALASAGHQLYFEATTIASGPGVYVLDTSRISTADDESEGCQSVGARDASVVGVLLFFAWGARQFMRRSSEARRI